MRGIYGNNFPKEVRLKNAFGWGADKYTQTTQYFFDIFKIIIIIKDIYIIKFISMDTYYNGELDYPNFPFLNWWFGNENGIILFGGWRFWGL